jgi:hypothetical protein
MYSWHRVTIAISLLFCLDAGIRGAPISMTGDSGSYTQRFDTLGSSGTAIWTNDVTLPGWYAVCSKLGDVTNCTASAGDSLTGRFYSFGTNNAADRALGSIGADTPGHFSWGVALRNNSDEAVTNLSVAYDGEQWRQANAAAQAITFGYLVAPVMPALTASGYTAVPALDFTSPVMGGSTGALDGDLSGNRVALTHSFAVTVPAGQMILLRWHDPDHTGSDHGLAIDDLRLDWQASDALAPAAEEVMGVGPAGAREDFDNLGVSATAPLPTGWRVDKQTYVRVVAGYAAAVPFTELRAGANMSSSADHGIYNFGAGDAASAGDRAVGGLSSGDAGKSVNVYVRLRNDTGQTISRWHVRYRIEKYRQGTNPGGGRMQLYASANGRDWQAVPPGADVFAADTVTAGYTVAPGSSTREERMVTLSVPAGGFFYLAWNYAVAEGATTSNAQALGLDDVEINPPATILMLR